MISENLKWFILSYILLVIAILFMAFDLLVISGLLIGLSTYCRSTVRTSLESPSVIQLIQNMPKWKWFSVLYLFSLMVWLLNNMSNKKIYQINSLLFTAILFFPFIIPYALNEYKVFKNLKLKK